MKFNFLNRFSENTQIRNLMKIRPVGAELLHTDRQTYRRKDGQTDITKLIVAFRNSANAPKILKIQNEVYICFYEISKIAKN